MKITLLAAIAALSLFSVTARAESEGNGDPFVFRAPGLVTVTSRPAQAVPMAQAVQQTAEAARARMPVRQR